MNQALKTKWVDALRSGVYQQCFKSLRTTDGKYCVLGVLFTVANLIRRSPDYLSQLESEKEIQIPFNLGAKLEKMNDVDRLSFCEMADWIEENL